MGDVSMNWNRRDRKRDKVSEAQKIFEFYR
jgi:hypothetical protein